MALTWRCQPAPLGPWQKSLGWILAAVTLVETALAAKIFHFAHPILIGVLFAASVPAIFPLRALRRAPRLTLEDGSLRLWAPWAVAPTEEMPTSLALASIDVAGAGLIDLEQRPDVRVVDRAANERDGGAVVSGWRQLANGKKAHVWISPSRPALYLSAPTGSALLLDLRDPESLLAEMGALANKAT